MKMSYFNKLKRTALQLLTIITPLVLLSACGGGSGGSDKLIAPPTTQSNFTITLAASEDKLNSGDNTTLTATVTDASGKAVTGQNITFEFGSNLSGATLSAASGISDSNGKTSVRLTAGTYAGNDSIIANVTDSKGKIATASVSVTVSASTSGGTLRVSLAATKSSLNGGENTILNAIVTDASGKALTGQNVTFAFGTNLSGATLSAISGTSNAQGAVGVRYTAGNNSGTDSIIATVTDADGKTASASTAITITASATASTLRVSITPASSSLKGGESVALNAIVTDSTGKAISNQSVTFAFGTNISGATLSTTSGISNTQGSAGVRYTAGSNAGTDSIIATVTDANGKISSSSANVTVAASSNASTLRVALSAVKPNLLNNEETILTATITNADGSPAAGKSVGFILGSNLSGGVLSAATALSGSNGVAQVRYTAGAQSGVDTVIASVKDANDKEASASLNITVSATQTQIGSVSLLSSNTAIGTNSGSSIDVIVQVKSASNVLMPNIPVTLTADKGSLLLTNSVTDATGSITGKLSTKGLYDNTQITLNASANGLSATALIINVTGTSINLSGPSSAEINKDVAYTLTLTDSGDKPIAGKQVSLTSTKGTVNPTSVTTDSTGRASFNVKSDQATVITATALGASATATLTVANTSVEFTAPTIEYVNIGTPSTEVKVIVKELGTPKAGVAVNFASTRGIVTPPSATTDANGVATVSITSATSGPATITATYGSIIANKLVTFTAPTATQISLQADPSVVNVNSQTTVTAILRDANQNIVANKPVTFSIVADASGGSLSASTAVTDANGRASVVFTAGATATAENGVTVRATTDGIQQVTSLTVAGQALFVRLGTDEKIYLSPPNVYKTFSVLVTDSAGLPVPGALISIKVNPVNFYKGRWVAGIDKWVVAPDPATSCPSEDLTNNNGILDPGEDTNGNSLLDPGNVATVVFKNGSNTTDKNGFAYVDIYYPQSYGIWVDVDIVATAKVVGTESTASTGRFNLPVRSELVNNPDGPAPSANPSPWGSSTNCNNLD